MTRDMTVSDSVVIAVDAATVYAEIADPSQMGRWSPENLGARTPASGVLSVGDVFVGANKRGLKRWNTRCRVTAAEPGVHFAFRVDAIGLRTPRLRTRIATWDYAFEPVEGGTRVTETWTDDRRWSDRAAAVFDKIATRGSLFCDYQRRNIATTLARLKADLEPSPRP